MAKTTTTQETPEAVPVKASTKGGIPAEQHAEDAKTPDWLFASTKAYHGWAVGKELSRAEYDAAVEKAANCSTASLKDAQGRDTTGLVK